eukprot:SAG11_NODE_2329_length_3511_cov_58.602286_2_plen_62_part_00
MVVRGVLNLLFTFYRVLLNLVDPHSLVHTKLDYIYLLNSLMKLVKRGLIPSDLRRASTNPR